MDGTCTNWAEEFLAVCAGPNRAITTKSPGRICFAPRKRLYGAKTIAAAIIVGSISKRKRALPAPSSGTVVGCKAGARTTAAPYAIGGKRRQ